MTTWGIDLSNHQPAASIARAHAAGAAFVFAKASEGVTFVDKHFAGFRRDAHRAGVPFGAYHFAKPQAGRSAVDEARHFLSVIGTVQVGELPPVLDLEWSRLGRRQTAQWALTWLRYVEGVTGVRPIVYVSPGFMASNVATTSDLARYPLWLANYRHTEPPAPAPWKHWLFWQETSSAHVVGVPGTVDRNRTHLTPAGVRALCRQAVALPSHPRPPAPSPHPAPAPHKPAPKPAPTPVHHKPAPHPKPAPVVRTKAGGTVLGARRLARGSRGPDVAFVQRFLGLPDDGIFGADTYAAVVGYQHMRHLSADGVVGRLTWRSMLSRH